MALPGLPGGPIGMGIGLDARTRRGRYRPGRPRPADRDYYLRKVIKQFADIRAA